MRWSLLSIARLAKPALVVFTLTLNHWAIASARAEQAQIPAPSPGAAARARCAELTRQGPRAAALAACDEAARASGEARDHAAIVPVLLAGPEGPTSLELWRAWLHAESALRIEPQGVLGELAAFEVARRWGDPSLIDTRARRLAPFAPAHEEVRRALGTLRDDRAWLKVVGWILLLVLLIGTAGHAVRTIWRRRAANAATAATAANAAGLLLLVSLLYSGSASAAPPTAASFPVNDDRPADSVPDTAAQLAHPMAFATFLQELIAKAEVATAQTDHASAVRYYLALAKATPTRATAFSRLCESLEAAGRPEDAAKACRAATGLEGSVAADYLRLGRILLAGQDPLPAERVSELEGLITHLRGQSGVSVFGEHLACELATRQRDLAGLERCVGALEARAPGDPKTVTFSFALAIERRDRRAADEALARAEKAGVAADGLARMKAVTAELHGHTGLLAAGAAPIAIAFGVLLLGWAAIRSRRRVT